MKVLKLFFVFVLFSTQVFSQNVQWASKVIKASAGLGEKGHSAQQALGKPDVYPMCGAYRGAWTPIRPNKKFNIHVEFATPQEARQLILVEVNEPGALKKVILFDEEGKEHVVKELEAKHSSRACRVQHIPFTTTTYKVKGAKLIFDGKSIEGYQSIDAIGISASDKEIVLDRNIDDGVNMAIKPKKLSSNVNTKGSEIKPLVSHDGQYLVFSRVPYNEDKESTEGLESIYVAKWNDTTKIWGEAFAPDSKFNNKGPNYISAISKDSASGKTALVFGNTYSNNQKKMKAGISIATETEDGWSEPEALVIGHYNNESTISHYFINRNMTVLLMAIKEKDTYGSTDLYVSFHNHKDNTWSTPKNMGKNINTVGEELAPYLASDNKTLYFSTDGKPGFGKKDIYVSRRRDDTWTNWTEPENLGPQVNTANDELFFSLKPDGNTAYFCRSDEKTNNLDIYFLNLKEFFEPGPVVMLTGTVRSKKDNKAIAKSKVRFEDLITRKGTSVYTDENGGYKVFVPYGAEYGVFASAKDHIAIHNTIDLRFINEYEVKNMDLFLSSAEKNAVIVFNNVFFDFNKTELKEESFGELDRLADYLNARPKRKIEIRGYTDNIGGTNINLYISKKRAEAVYNYLIKKGVSEKQLKFKGLGKEEPIASNDTKEGRRENRRVEFEIIK